MTLANQVQDKVSRVKRPPVRSPFHSVRHAIDFAPFNQGEIDDRLEEGIVVPSRRPILHPIPDSAQHAEYRLNDTLVRGTRWEGDDLIVVTDDHWWASRIFEELKGSQASAPLNIELRFRDVHEARIAFIHPNDSVHWSRRRPEDFATLSWHVHSLRTYRRHEDRFVGALIAHRRDRDAGRTYRRFPRSAGSPMIVLAIDCGMLATCESGREVFPRELGSDGLAWWQRVDRGRHDPVANGLEDPRSWIAEGIG